MGDRSWSWSTCNPLCMWYGVPGEGTRYWTSRFGEYWVGGFVYQWYSWHNYECTNGTLGVPVKAYGPISEFGGGVGQWFERGCIIYKYATQGVGVYVGAYGQTAGRLVDTPIDESQFTELEGGPPGDWSVLEEMPEAPPAPKPPGGDTANERL